MLDTNSKTDAERALFSRLSIGVSSPVEPARVLGGVWEIGIRPSTRPDDAATDPETDARRAEAHAAFRSVATPGHAAIDAALGVVETEVARLRRTVLAYGEALKEIEVYGGCAEARKTAAKALRRAPERLTSAPPVPHLDHIARGLHG
jgi:hypothetical protein